MAKYDLAFHWVHELSFEFNNYRKALTEIGRYAELYRYGAMLKVRDSTNDT